LRRKFAKLWLILRHQIIRSPPRRLSIEYVEDVPLIILPDVFNPVLFRTGEFLARALGSTSLLNQNHDHLPLVLDLGCGSGIGAVFAARLGARVTAVDINPEAIRCVRMNAILNCVDDKIDPRFGDLFEPVETERFDLVLFNPPFYRGQPKSNLDLAWRSEKVFERFTENLQDHLTLNGQALIVLSTDGDGRCLLEMLKVRGFVITPVSSRDFGNEVITVYQVNPVKSVPENHDHSL
jgi:HemK-related putative methylase